MEVKVGMQTHGYGQLNLKNYKVGKRFTLEDLQKLPLVKVNDFTHLAKNRSVVIPDKNIPVRSIPRAEPMQVTEMKRILKYMQIDYVTELQFLKPRQFRFDIAIVDKKIAIEYEGLFAQKSGHTTVTGYTSNCEKYNLAQINGWKVLRYTALNYKDVVNDLRSLL